jgi:hypothetical protein
MNAQRRGGDGGAAAQRRLGVLQQPPNVCRFGFDLQPVVGFETGDEREGLEAAKRLFITAALRLSNFGARAVPGMGRSRAAAAATLHCSLRRS